MVTEAEFQALKAMQYAHVRVFTLVPLDAVGLVVATYGCTPTSEALLNALELPRPAEWPDLPADGERVAQEGEGEQGRGGRRRARAPVSRMAKMAMTSGTVPVAAPEPLQLGVAARVVAAAAIARRTTALPQRRSPTLLAWVRTMRATTLLLMLRLKTSNANASHSTSPRR